MQTTTGDSGGSIFSTESRIAPAFRQACRMLCDPARLAEQVAQMRQALEEAACEAGGQVEISVRSNYRSYRLDPDAAPVRRAEEAARRLGLTVRHRSTGGGSDANYFNERGIPTAVLCCGFEKVHTCEERMPVSQLTLLAQWVAAILDGGQD